MTSRHCLRQAKIASTVKIQKVTKIGSAGGVATSPWMGKWRLDFLLAHFLQILGDPDLSHENAIRCFEIPYLFSVRRFQRVPKDTRLLRREFWISTNSVGSDFAFSTRTDDNKGARPIIHLLMVLNSLEVPRHYYCF